MFSKAKGKTKLNHEVLGLYQGSFRLHDVITVKVIGRIYPKEQEDTRYSSSRCVEAKMYREIRERHLPQNLLFEKLRLTLAKKRCDTRLFPKVFVFSNRLRHLLTSPKCLFST